MASTSPLEITAAMSGRAKIDLLNVAGSQTVVAEQNIEEVGAVAAAKVSATFFTAQVSRFLNARSFRASTSCSARSQ